MDDLKFKQRDKTIMKNETFRDYMIVNIDQLPKENEYLKHERMHIWSIAMTFDQYISSKQVSTTWQKTS